MSLLKPLHVFKAANKCLNVCNNNLNKACYSTKESFLSGTNANFLENQYLDWAQSKGSIDSSWDSFYDSLCGNALKIEDVEDEFAPRQKSSEKSSGKDVTQEQIRLHLAVQNLIRSYQTRGHLLAKTDPLELTLPARMLNIAGKLPLDTKVLDSHIVARELGGVLTEKHMDMVFTLPDRTFIGGNEKALPLREIIRRLEHVYCGSIGLEYMHVYDIDAVQFLRKRVETPGAYDRTPEEKKLTMKRLTKAVFLEKYFATKWPAEKRFGLEGGESMIVMLEEIVDTASRLGVKSIVIGMQHRGRLNMLVNVCRKQLVDIFAQFKPMQPKEPFHNGIWTTPDLDNNTRLGQQHPFWTTPVLDNTRIGQHPTWTTPDLDNTRLGQHPTWTTSDLDNIRLGQHPTWTTSDLDNIRLGLHPTWTTSDLDNIRLGQHPTWTTSDLDNIRLGQHPTWTTSDLDNIRLGQHPTWTTSDLDNIRLGQHPTWTTSDLDNIRLGSGDVKYHLGTHIHRFIRRTNKYIKVSMSANPSHLETVGPVVAGKTRAEQFFKGDNGDTVMAIIMHGDAAVAGQGVVYETATQTNLPAFTTRGCLHIVCNNQIGYTTDPRFSRSSPYCTDLGKAIDAPILHVNGDDGDAVAFVARVAIEYRCKFKKDVMLDLVCYRRHGHSEEDEPMYTQPFMYKKIKSMPTVDVVYSNKLKAEGVASDTDIKVWQKEYMDTLNEHFELAKKVTKLSIMDWIDTPWTGFLESVDPNVIKETGICQTTINTIANHFASPPEKWAFELHKGLERMLAARQKMVKEGIADWPMGEALAYGSLLRDQIHIRFTGEDVERGTMAHRHHVYHHQGVDGATYRVLDTVYPDQAIYSLHNSALSEYGTVGFEVGYSYASPHLLTIWEAQYGDFADTGQPIYDTFIANAESKWMCQSGVVIHLPHGIDGAGPEHSSGRVERYLQQSDDDEDVVPNLDDKLMPLKQLRTANWIVANVTNPANYFHLIRRQLALPFRKPLILFTPKIGLKHPYYRSKFADFLPGTAFRRVIPEDGPASKNPKDVKKLIFCSGNVAIKISEVVKEKKLENQIAMCRIEQLYPLPYDLILKEFCKYEQAKLCFCQEEHKNQGPWPFCRNRIENLLGKKIHYIGRAASPASATGIKWLHQKELKELKEAIVAL
ncbi:unnamed protein product [Arctia plantaginis]|uniref:2-oxoglutarate dehydrogenase, mitochondrial n=1 Tax=Arctia plantaginis TaxID=874455 RepID=A0A8S1B2M3_ARCPL|nr:unnamed protein product [Arctia plantaginis]